MIFLTLRVATASTLLFAAGLDAESFPTCSVPPQPAGVVLPLSARDKTICYLRQGFSVVPALIALVPAGAQMADSPGKYPRSWKDGGGAFARNYGDGLATQEAALLSRSLAATLLSEDPRYFPSTHKNGFRRTADAVLFAVVDRADDGRKVPALSNFAGAVTAGFVGRAYLPPGYNDNVHAMQRSVGSMVGYRSDIFVGYVLNNVLEEFTPDLKRLAHRFRRSDKKNQSRPGAAASQEQR